MTEAQVFKHLAEQCRQQAVYFRRHFNFLALANVFSAIWMAGAGFYIWMGMAMPWRLMGLVLLVFSGMAVHLAHSTRRYGQRAFEDFMQLRSNNLKMAAELETGAG